MLPTRNDYSFKPEREMVKEQWALFLYQKEFKKETKHKELEETKVKITPVVGYLLTNKQRKTVACLMGNKRSKIIVHQLSNQKDFSFQKVLSFYEETFMMATGLQPQSIYSKLA